MRARCIRSRAPRSDGPAVVFLGGGGGSSTALSGLRSHAGHVTGIINVADNGGGSGRLLGGLGYPPGDLRRAMIALAKDPDGPAARLCGARFDARFPDQAGQSLGNLVFAAAQMTGAAGMREEIAEVARLLGVCGDVFPMTFEHVTLEAVMEDNAVVQGEAEIGNYGAAVRRVRLVPECVSPPPEALAAITRANSIIIGPGSIFSSILPVLLVPGIAEAIADSRAARFFVTNVVNESVHDVCTASEYVKAVAQYFPGLRLFDFVICNVTPSGSETEACCAAEGLRLVKADLETVRALGYTPVGEALIGQDVRQHDGARLASLIAALTAKFHGRSFECATGHVTASKGAVKSLRRSACRRFSRL